MWSSDGRRRFASSANILVLHSRHSRRTARNRIVESTGARPLEDDQGSEQRVYRMSDRSLDRGSKQRVERDDVLS